MDISISKLRLEVIAEYYRKKYRNLCVPSYDVFSLEYYHKDTGLQRLPYVTVAFDTMRNLLAKHGEKLSSFKIDNVKYNHDPSTNGVLIIKPRAQSDIDMCGY